MTSNRQAISELLERVRAATGLDREIDFAITKSMGDAPVNARWKLPEPDRIHWPSNEWELPSFRDANNAWIEKFKAFVQSDDYRTDPLKFDRENPSPLDGIDWKNAPPVGFVLSYTSSLDAIVALIERELPGCVWGILNDFGELHRAHIAQDIPGFRPGPYTTEDAETPALALCAAFLSALSAKLETMDGKTNDQR